MREFLHRMRDRFHIDHRYRRILRDGLDHAILAVDRPVLEFWKGAHTDQIDITREHTRDLCDMFLCLAVHHGAGLELDRPGVLARLQHDRVSTELERAELETRA